MRIKKSILILIFLYTFIMIGLLIVVIISGRDYRFLLLVDDGYYNIAKSIFQGKLIGSIVGIGYPLLLTPLYLFPESFHPFLRLFLSLVITGMSIVLVFRIFQNYFIDKEIFLGCLLFILNPLYIHWTFKSRVEIPLILFLGLFIFYLQKYLQEKKLQHLIIFSISIVLGILTKPVFMLIPLFILLVFIIKRNKIILNTSIILIIISFVSFFGVKRIAHIKEKINYYKIPAFYGSAVYVDAIISNLDFKSQYNFVKDKQGRLVPNPRLESRRDEVNKINKKYNNTNPALYGIILFYEKPRLLIQQLIFNPIFAYSLSGTEKETFFHMLINTILMILSIYGIVKIENKSIELYVHLASVFSIYAVLILVHSRGPYFIPIIPYLFVFSGRPVNIMINKVSSIYKKNIQPKFQFKQTQQIVKQ